MPVESRILNFLKLSKLPVDLNELLELPLTKMKGCSDEQSDFLKTQKIEAIKDLLVIKNAEKLLESDLIDASFLEKIVTSARIIENLATGKIKDLRKITFAGLNKAGKTTIIQTLRDPVNYKPGSETPTIGVEYSKLNILGFETSVFDLGGQQNYRKMYLEKSESKDHFGLTDLFVFVIDVLDKARIKESLEYLSSIIEILKYLGETPYCLILAHKVDKLKDKETQNRIKEIEKNLKKIKGFQMSLHPSSAFLKESLYKAFGTAFREISMVNVVLSEMIKYLKDRINIEYVSLFNKTGICIAEIGETHREFLRNFTINVLLGEELGLFPKEAKNLILRLEDGYICILERLNLAKEPYYLSWVSKESDQVSVKLPNIEEMQMWLEIFFS